MGLIGFIIGAATGGYAGLWAGSAARDAAEAQAKAQKKQYQAQAENFRSNARVARGNAEGLLDYGVDLMETATDKHNTSLTNMSFKQGMNKLRVGSSSVEMSGSARMFLEQNTQMMNRDLDSIMRSADQRWGKTMLERESTLETMHNALWSAEKYTEMADSIDVSAAGDAAFWGTWTSTFTSGASVGAMLPI